MFVQAVWLSRQQPRLARVLQLHDWLPNADLCDSSTPRHGMAQIASPSKIVFDGFVDIGARLGFSWDRPILKAVKVGRRECA